MVLVLGPYIIQPALFVIIYFLFFYFLFFIFFEPFTFPFFIFLNSFIANVILNYKGVEWGVYPLYWKTQHDIEQRMETWPHFALYDYHDVSNAKTLWLGCMCADTWFENECVVCRHMIYDEWHEICNNWSKTRLNERQEIEYNVMTMIKLNAMPKYISCLCTRLKDQVKT